MTNHKRLQIFSFLILLIVGAGLVFAVIRPFLSILVLSLILAVLFRPVFDKMNRYVKSESLAALSVLALILLIVGIPLYFLGQVLFVEIFHLVNSLRDGSLVINRSELISTLPLQAQNFVESVSIDLSRLASTFTNNAFQTVSKLLSNLATFLFSVFLTFFATYYFLKDGEHFKQAIMDLSPIDNNQESILFNKVSSAVNGVVKGQFLTALIQGVVATTGYVIFGVPSPFLWGMFTVIAALVPTVGTSLAWIPVVLYLFITGHTGAALGMLIWGSVAVGLIDNFIGPKLLGRTAKIHPLLVLISVLGGISLFGFIGFLLGPILMAIFVAMVDMYRTDFKKYIDR